MDPRTITMILFAMIPHSIDSGLKLDYCLRINISIAVQKIRYEVLYARPTPSCMVCSTLRCQMIFGWSYRRYFFYFQDFYLYSTLSLLVSVACRTSLISWPSFTSGFGTVWSLTSPSLLLLSRATILLFVQRRNLILCFSLHKIADI